MSIPVTDFGYRQSDVTYDVVSVWKDDFFRLDAYVAMDCLRGVPLPGLPRHPANARNYLVADAVPWVSLATPVRHEATAP